MRDAVASESVSSRVGNIARQAREQAGISQAGFAEECGMRHPCSAEWSAAQRTPPSKRLTTLQKHSGKDSKFALSEMQIILANCRRLLIRNASNECLTVAVVVDLVYYEWFIDLKRTKRSSIVVSAGFPAGFNLYVIAVDDIECVVFKLSGGDPYDFAIRG